MFTEKFRWVLLMGVVFIFLVAGLLTQVATVRIISERLTPQIVTVEKEYPTPTTEPTSTPSSTLKATKKPVAE